MPFKIVNPIKLTIAIIIVLLLVAGGAMLSGMITRSKLAGDYEIVHKAEITTYNGRMAVAHYKVLEAK
jgi:hypothetical protein